MPKTSLKSTYLLWICLAALVSLPLLTVGLLYQGIKSERGRFSAYASVATQLEGIQDAEVDFSLARRAAQAYFRIGDPVDREAARSLIELSRRKIAAVRSPGDEPTDRMLGALDTQLMRYDQVSQKLFELSAQRRTIADQRLRNLASQIDDDLGEYALRWQRNGLNAIAAPLARALATVADPRLRPSYRPDDLAAAAARPLALAATVEIAAPDAAAVVRRAEARLTAFVAAWRELVAIDMQIASLADGEILAIGEAISNRFEALTDASTARQSSLYQASQGAHAGDDVLVSIVAAATLLAAGAGAFAASRLFAQQATRMRSEGMRHKALETVLAQLEAAVRSGSLGLRTPQNAAAPATATSEPSTAIARDAPQPAPPPLPPAIQSDTAAARSVPNADPSSDELIKMLMASLPPTPAPNAN